jgi:hypothetical protein
MIGYTGRYHGIGDAVRAMQYSGCIGSSTAPLVG